jgi:hypothetical protein
MIHTRKEGVGMLPRPFEHEQEWAQDSTPHLPAEMGRSMGPTAGCDPCAGLQGGWGAFRNRVVHRSRFRWTPE